MSAGGAWPWDGWLRPPPRRRSGPSSASCTARWPRCRKNGGVQCHGRGTRPGLGVPRVPARRVPGGGFTAAWSSGRSGALHAAMTAVLGLVLGLVASAVMVPFDAVLAWGVAAPPANLGPSREALAGGLLLFLSDLFGGCVGGKLGEPMRPDLGRPGYRAAGLSHRWQASRWRRSVTVPLTEPLPETNRSLRDVKRRRREWFVQSSDRRVERWRPQARR